MRCLYCGKPLPLLKKLTGGGEFCSDAHRHKYQEEYNKLALSRLLQAQSPAQSQQVTSSGLTPRALRQLPPPAPRPGQRALAAPEPLPPPPASAPVSPYNTSRMATPPPIQPVVVPPVVPPPIPQPSAQATQGTPLAGKPPTAAPAASKPPTATGSFQYRPSGVVNDDTAEQLPPDMPLAMFHIDRFEPLRAASRITFRKPPVEPVYSSQAMLPALNEGRTADPFDWDLIAGLLTAPEIAVVEEVEEVEEAALEPDPPMAPAWDPPIPFAEYPLHVPKVLAEEADVFPGQVVRPAMPAVALPIRPPQPYTAKVASPVPDKGLGTARKAVLLERPSAWCIANGLAQPSILREWQSWRPVFDPVRAPQTAKPIAPSMNGVDPKLVHEPQQQYNAPLVNKITDAPAAAPAKVPVAPPLTEPPAQHHEVVINLAALGLLDD